MDNEFIYFLHGTTIIDESAISDIFDNGIINIYGDNMNSTMIKAELNGGNIVKKVKEYPNIPGNAVFVIRIPKYYLTPRIKDGKLKQIPLPIWKSIEQNDTYNKASQLAPELIYGVYLKDKESFKVNPNYSPVFNPSGMHYDSTQIDYLLSNSIVDWHIFATQRKEKPYNVLKREDESVHAWDSAIAIYGSHFGYVAPKKKVG